MMLKCPKCGAEMLAEGAGEGRTKFTCPKDGTNEVRDAKGRKYLADSGSGRKPLLG